MQLKRLYISNKVKKVEKYLNLTFNRYPIECKITKPDEIYPKVDVNGEPSCVGTLYLDKSSTMFQRS